MQCCLSLLEKIKKPLSNIFRNSRENVPPSVPEVVVAVEVRQTAIPGTVVQVAERKPENLAAPQVQHYTCFFVLQNIYVLKVVKRGRPLWAALTLPIHPYFRWVKAARECSTQRPRGRRSRGGTTDRQTRNRRAGRRTQAILASL